MTKIEIKVKPKNWMADIKGDPKLKKWAEQTLFFMDKKWKKSYPVHLYGKTGFRAGLVDFLNLQTDSYKFTLDLPPLEYDINELDEMFGLRSYQKDAVEAVLSHGMGIVKSPTGSGKTRIEMAVATVMPKPLLLLVHSKSLLYQLYGDFKDMGFTSIGMYGDGRKELDKDITIMIMQSFSYRKYIKTTDKQGREKKKAIRPKEIKDFLSRCKSILADEVHHCTKKAYADLGRCSAVYRAGFSATPWPKDATDLTKARLIANFGGKVFDGEGDTRITPFIHKPKVYVINRKTIPHNQDEIMQAILRRDFIQMRRFVIVRDKKRNEFILRVAELCRLNGYNVYVIVAWKEHIAELEALSGNMDNIHFLTGETNSKTREAVYGCLEDEEESHIICGTVGGEGVDIPRLNFVILADIGKSEIKVIQGIGRAARKAEGKEVAAVIDIKDTMFASHHKKRQAIYKEENFEVLGTNDLWSLLE